MDRNRRVGELWSLQCGDDCQRTPIQSALPMSWPCSIYLRDWFFRASSLVTGFQDKVMPAFSVCLSMFKLPSIATAKTEDANLTEED